MKTIYALFILATLFSCTSEPEVKSSNTSTEDEIKVESIEEKLVRNVEGTLRIPATEKYHYQIYSEQLNLDDSLDYIITVNREEFAIDQSIQAGTVQKQSILGFMGTYNFIFFMDGATKKITPPIPVASSAKRKLSISFEHIRSEAYKDVLVDYGIKNSLFRRIYTAKNKDLTQTFESKIYDGLGEDKTEAYYFKYVPGSYSLAKDIDVYKGILEKITVDKPEEIFTFNPTIKQTDVFERKWFFNDNVMKYYTRTDN